jgi:hypothetical protein
MSQTNPIRDSLAAINNATLGAYMPIVTLPGGQKVRTGTVGSLLVNIKAYDGLAAQGETEDEEKKKKAELEARMAASLPLLKQVGKNCYVWEIDTGLY